ncbi:hypothetical protein [uncultured Helicobacter sp.]|uniref:hypothetical protein n=1 Tax=uncultured Helicobacter sp. TaxID=175537 RepID=UPI00260FEEB2|nr:hypothetical protein [uncultured Helicobacter sp.]
MSASLVSALIKTGGGGNPSAQRAAAQNAMRVLNRALVLDSAFGLPAVLKWRIRAMIGKCLPKTLKQKLKKLLKSK